MGIINTSLIRHFAVSGSTIAAVDASDTIHVWSLSSFAKLHEVPTFPKAPGISLAMSRDCSTLFAGSWYAGGAMAYSLSEGRELWRRKDLARFSGITADGWDGGLYCCFDGKVSLRLDPQTGETVEKLRGVREVYSSNLGEWYMTGRRNLHVAPEVTGSRFRMLRATFAVLGVAFAPDRVAVTESGGPIRCFNLATGEEIWRHTPVSGVHLIDLAFCELLDLFVGVEWPYESGGIRRLVHVTKDSGAVSVMADLPRALALTFCASGGLLVTSEGDVIEVASGRISRRIDFPREEYEDPEFPSWEERMQTGTPEQREFARLLGPPSR